MDGPFAFVRISPWEIDRPRRESMIYAFPGNRRTLILFALFVIDYGDLSTLIFYSLSYRVLFKQCHISGSDGENTQFLGNTLHNLCCLLTSISY